MLALVTFDKHGKRKDIPLGTGAYTIGRKPDADLRIPLNDISREHCELSVNGNTVSIRDLGSSNGTFVNQKRISQTTLKAGDQITLGPVTLTVQIDGVPRDVRPTELRGLKETPPAGKGPAARPPAPKKAAAAPALSDAIEDLDIDDLSDLSPADADAGDLSDFDIDELSDLDIDQPTDDFKLDQETLKALDKKSNPKPGK